MDARKRGPAGVRRKDALFRHTANKQGRTIARRAIAVAMAQGGSFEIGSQIFSGFVQVQTVTRHFPKKLT